ncbi:MAG TPA: hypothetical protein VLX11_07495 [Candidatus Acidoferrales bacterium]|nr:hypothetical protein [Candidatus Acidoferrales bacterium]
MAVGANKKTALASGDKAQWINQLVGSVALLDKRLNANPTLDRVSARRLGLITPGGSELMV